MHRRFTHALAGILIVATSGSEAHQVTSSTSSVKPLTKVKITKKSTSTSIKPKVALVQNVAKLPSSIGLGLIESTDGKQRAEQVMQGRNDPFSGIITPIPVKKTPLPKKVFPVLPKLRVSELPTPPPAPPKPETKLASSIGVEGTIQIGDKYHAIVKLPNNALSQSVTEGQKLLGGRVLVKRIHIDSTSGVDPTVIFEENGVEVASAAGFVPTNSKDKSIEPTETTAASPMAQITAEVASKPSNVEEAQQTAANVLPTPSLPSINKSYYRTKNMTAPPPIPDFKSNHKTGIENYSSQHLQKTLVSNNKTRSSQSAFNDLPKSSETTADSLATRNRVAAAKKSSLEIRQTNNPQYASENYYEAGLNSQQRYIRLTQKLRYGRKQQTVKSTVLGNEFTQQSIDKLGSNADYNNYKKMQLIKRLRDSSKF